MPLEATMIMSVIAHPQYQLTLLTPSYSVDNSESSRNGDYT